VFPLKKKPVVMPKTVLQQSKNETISLEIVTIKE
jgi:hypothetical protein